GEQLRHQAVVLCVRHRRIVLDVIAPIVLGDLFAQGRQTQPRILGGTAHENTRAARSVPARNPALSSWSYSALICWSIAGAALSDSTRPWSSSRLASSLVAKSRPTAIIRLNAWSSGT